MRRMEEGLRAEESGQPPDTGKDKESNSPPRLRREHSPADTLVLAWGALCLTPDLQHCKRTNFYHFSHQVYGNLLQEQQTRN